MNREFGRPEIRTSIAESPLWFVHQWDRLTLNEYLIALWADGTGTKRRKGDKF